MWCVWGGTRKREKEPGKVENNKIGRQEMVIACIVICSCLWREGGERGREGEEEMGKNGENCLLLCVVVGLMMILLSCVLFFIEGTLLKEAMWVGGGNSASPPACAC